MGGLYYVDLVEVLRAAGCTVAENGTTEGWESRARGSGGFASPPLAVVWHHTASDTAPANDLSWMIDGSDDAPIGNMLIDRDGVCWPIAAGAANTQGKGGPCSFSRGTAPLDSGNSTLWAVECANAGTGAEPWPVAQVDAFFRASNALNARFGNQPTDIITHALGDGTGWTDRKVDPATAGAVEGPWQPRSVTSSGTWSADDIRAECVRRAGAGPTPPPLPPPPWEAATMLWIAKDSTPVGVVWIGDNVTRRPIYDPAVLETFFDQYRRGGPPVYSPAYSSTPGAVTRADDVPAVPDTTLEWMGSAL
jgi:hypothetical protein